MNLLSVRGALVSGFGAMLLCCLLASGFRPGVVAAAETGVSGTPTRFANVLRIRGEITATMGEAGPSRTLREGDPVYVGERIRAAPAAEAVLKTDDAGLIAIRPGGHFVMERYAAEGKSTDIFDLRVLEGGLRMITGWFGRTNRSAYRVSTPTTTMGIRGTDHEPYVISTELSATLSQIAGTYDKVNRGGTTMDVNGKKLDIDPGQVGFARGTRSRALVTILLPVLLDKVPDFYVPGQFDAELDSLSQTADEDASRALEARRAVSPDQSPAGTPDPDAPTRSAPSAAPAVEPPAAAAEAVRKPAVPAGADCAADAVARTWLSEFDKALERRDASAIVRKFAPEVLVRATVRGAGGELTTVEMGRDEMAKSTIAAVRGLTEFQQRRPSIEGRPAGGGKATCDRISVRSVAIEQGRQNGKPYRFESLEEYLLERRAGVWLAIQAQTTQR